MQSDSLSAQLRAVAWEALRVHPRRATAPEPGLAEFAERVVHNADLLVAHEANAIDPVGLRIAGWFVFSGWKRDVENHLPIWGVFQKPPGVEQRELAVETMRTSLAGIKIEPKSIETAAAAIADHVNRDGHSIEARLLADAMQIEDIGLGYLLRRLKRFEAEGRTMAELLKAWKQLRDYRYWDYRINDGLRSEAARELARARLGDADRVIEALERLYGSEANSG